MRNRSKIKKTAITMLSVMVVALCPAFKSNASSQDAYGANAVDVELDDIRNILHQASYDDLYASGGEITIDGKWDVSCNDYSSYSLQSVYSSEKSHINVLRVKRHGTNVEAFSITQRVSYVINDYSDTVTITSYKTSYNIYLSDFTITKDISEAINNAGSNYFATATARYKVSSPIEGGFIYVVPKVRVERSGITTVECPYI